MIHLETSANPVDLVAPKDDPVALRDFRLQIRMFRCDGARYPSIEGADHPLKRYRQAGVSVVLSADDEGLIRIDLTHEYVRPAMAAAALDTAFDIFERQVLSRRHE